MKPGDLVFYFDPPHEQGYVGIIEYVFGGGRHYHCHLWCYICGEFYEQRREVGYSRVTPAIWTFTGIVPLK